MAALPHFVLQTPPPKVDGDSPAGSRAADLLAGGLNPSSFNQKQKKHPITGTPRELGCCLLLPSDVHSRCQTRTLVLNLAGDEGC